MLPGSLMKKYVFWLLTLLTALVFGCDPRQDSSPSGITSALLTVLRGRQNDSNVQKLAKLLHSPEVKQFINEKYQGAVIPAFQHFNLLSFRTAAENIDFPLEVMGIRQNQ